MDAFIQYIITERHGIDNIVIFSTYESPYQSGHSTIKENYHK